MGANGSAPQYDTMQGAVLNVNQLSPSVQDEILRRRKKQNDYSLAAKVRMEVFHKTELPFMEPVWKASRDVLTFGHVPYQAGYGFVFGMCWRIPVDLWQGSKAANWRISGGIGRVQRESHFSAGRFASFVGLLYFFETILFKATGRHGKEETAIAAFFTAGSLAAPHGLRQAATQGAIAAGFMYCLISFTEWFSKKAQVASVVMK
eukprot:TRINITY_DN3041_c0_g1_i1.p1 TRINITY_DN3041_c0_g1~~TRINITY_DN3041_c0_g1_i1.p1  ORF type:complete len:205 (+),score=30.63 TRINITY_DN3041_c0_g1_i1:82-696(+)